MGGFWIDGQPDDTHYDGFNFTGTAGGRQQADAEQQYRHVDAEACGTHTLWIKADYWGDAVAESNETNNLTSFTFEVTARPQADLDVVDNITAATSVMQGRPSPSRT